MPPAHQPQVFSPRDRRTIRIHAAGDGEAQDQNNQKANKVRKEAKMFGKGLLEAPG